MHENWRQFSLDQLEALVESAQANSLERKDLIAIIRELIVRLNAKH